MSFGQRTPQKASSVGRCINAGPEGLMLQDSIMYCDIQQEYSIIIYYNNIVYRVQGVFLSSSSMKATGPARLKQPGEPANLGHQQQSLALQAHTTVAGLFRV